jgi:hypothetical protein
LGIIAVDIVEEVAFVDIPTPNPPYRVTIVPEVVTPPSVPIV